ncbi:putative secreted protein [Colletotrichum trifolii]|uniref:Putative secreted protein n=1 Tax=Colletotrichum trifolii TaxID=5466 RepID=A0A4R8RUI5_COLTR|nr:putative secreted protein [Colletotrichum trifolii]
MVRIAPALALGFAGAAFASPVVHVERQDQPAAFVVTGLRYNGTGCPEGTLDGVLAADGTFDVSYKALSASIKPGEPKVNIKCQIQVDLSTQADTQLVVIDGTYRGHVKLTEGAWAKNQNQYKFANNDGVTNMEWPFKGPVDVATAFTNKLSTEFQSGCNSNGGNFTLIINNYLTLTTQGTGEGSISVTDLDGAVTQSVKLQTARCP